MSVDSPRSIEEIRRRKRQAEELQKMGDEKRQQMELDAQRRAQMLQQSCMGFCGFHPLKPMNFGESLGKLMSWVCHQLGATQVEVGTLYRMIHAQQIELICLKKALLKAGIAIPVPVSQQPQPGQEQAPSPQEGQPPCSSPSPT